jgi:zinc/manganese transport system substrate-binding protein
VRERSGRDVSGCLGMIVLSLALWLGLGAAARADPEGSPVRAVASFSILGDLVKAVGGEHVAVTVLVGPNGDGHSYEPRPADAKAVAAARLVFVNGLGFEGWMPRLAEAAGGNPTLVEVSRGIEPQTMEEDGKTVTDPHAWQSVPDARLMVGTIRDALVAADPGDRAAFEANAARYDAALAGLDAEVRAAIAAIPPERRRIITSHDAFGYFAKTYGLSFIAPQGVSTETEASAKAVAAIIRQVRAEKVPAVFLENVSDPRLLQRIAEETGAKIGGTLYSDALSPPDGEAGTYIAMVRHNIREFVGALGS